LISKFYIIFLKKATRRTTYTLESATKTLELMKKFDYEEADIKEMKPLIYDKIMKID